MEGGEQGNASKPIKKLFLSFVLFITISLQLVPTVSRYVALSLIHFFAQPLLGFLTISLSFFNAPVFARLKPTARNLAVDVAGVNNI